MRRSYPRGQEQPATEQAVGAAPLSGYEQARREANGARTAEAVPSRVVVNRVTLTSAGGRGSPGTQWRGQTTFLHGRGLLRPDEARSSSRAQVASADVQAMPARHGLSAPECQCSGRGREAPRHSGASISPMPSDDCLEGSRKQATPLWLAIGHRVGRAAAPQIAPRAPILPLLDEPFGHRAYIRISRRSWGS